MLGLPCYDVGFVVALLEALLKNNEISSFGMRIWPMERGYWWEKACIKYFFLKLQSLAAASSLRLSKLIRRIF